MFYLDNKNVCLSDSKCCSVNNYSIFCYSLYEITIESGNYEYGLEVTFNEMRYINLRFTYLLTYGKIFKRLV